MAEMELDRLTKVFDNDVRAVDGLDLTIDDGEFLVLVGPSGCGKSTALRMVAGLEEITEGELRIDGVRMNEALPRDRDVAMVFQSYALYPHLTVFENIAFGLQLRKVPKKEVAARVEEAARMLGLEDLLDRRPRQLSGGQRQRVAMGRAIVRHPKAFLMDEPLSNLDAKLRVQMRAEVAKLQRDMRVTTLYVTHDQVEAMTMGHRVAVMRKGVLQQVARPQILYDEPVNLFVAGFIGSPPMNMVESVLMEDDGGLAVKVGDQSLRLDDGLIAARSSIRSNVGRTIGVGIRPEDMEDASIKPDWPVDRRLRSKVQLTEALGSETVVHFEVDAPKLRTEDTRELEADRGSDTLAALDPTTTFVASFNARSQVQPGDIVELTVDTARLHLFDLETGAALY